MSNDPNQPSGGAPAPADSTAPAANWEAPKQEINVGALEGGSEWGSPAPAPTEAAQAWGSPSAAPSASPAAPAGVASGGQAWGDPSAAAAAPQAAPSSDAPWSAGPSVGASGWQAGAAPAAPTPAAASAAHAAGAGWSPSAGATTPGAGGYGGGAAGGWSPPPGGAGAPNPQGGGCGKIVLILGLLAVVGIGGIVAMAMLFRGGDADIKETYALVEAGTAYVVMEIEFTHAPRTDARDVEVTMYSSGFTRSPSFGWADIANYDDNPATTPDSDPPLNERLTVRFPVEEYLDGNVDFAYGVYVDMSIFYGGKWVDSAYENMEELWSDGGAAHIISATKSLPDGFTAYMNVTLQFDAYPEDAGAALQNVQLTVTSEAITIPATFDWNHIALYDDRADTMPGSPPPLGVPITVSLNINNNLNENVDVYTYGYGGATLYANVRLTWAGLQRDSSSVDITDLYVWD